MRSLINTFTQFALRAELYAWKSPWKVSLILAPVVFVLSVIVFPPAFETNDDAVMSMYASGKGIGLVPDEHLIFTHPFIGLILRILYSNAPNLPWYGLYLLGTHLVTHTIVAGILLTYRPLRVAAFFFLSWMLTIGIYCTTHLQFTTTSFLAAMGGLLLLCEAARITSERFRAKKLAMNTTPNEQIIEAAQLREYLPILRLLIIGAGLLLWSNMIRWYMFELMILMPLPLLGLWWCMYWPGWKNTFKAGVIYVAIIAAAWSSKQVHFAYYNADPDWRGFYEYNQLRAKFNDTGEVYYSDETKGVFQAAGWVGNDMYLIRSWCYDDPEVFGEAKLRQIYESHNWPHAAKSRKEVRANLTSLLSERGMQLAICLIIVLTASLYRDWKTTTLYLLAVGTAFAALVVLTIVQKTPPPRVFVPIMTWSIVASIWVSFASDPQKLQKLIRRDNAAKEHREFSLKTVFAALIFIPNNRYLLRLCAFALICIVGREVYFGYAFASTQQMERRQLRSDFESLNMNPSQLYVLWSTAVPIEKLDPLSSLSWMRDMRLICLGWPQQTVMHRKMKKQFGIDRLLKDWCDHPNVFVISNPICHRFYQRFSYQHFRQFVEVVETGKFRKGDVVQFRKTDQNTIGARTILRR
jgi:hypothetical protein